MGHRVVQTSAVYLLGTSNKPNIPPPSPPSPLSPQPSAEADCGPINDLALDPPAQTENDTLNDSPLHETRIKGAMHVLNTEATALRRLAALYETDSIAQAGFHRAVAAITRHGGEKGKLVIIGVGKSGHIARKLVATFNSLAVHATFLHPTEALHGDLGTIGRHDTILFITFSGKTQELLSLLPHIDPSLPQIILTSHTRPETCEMIRRRPETILLPAPIHEPEALSFGVCAPTTSTTMALAVGDALAVVTSQELHSCVATVFAKNHPGGAIGAAFQSSLSSSGSGSTSTPTSRPRVSTMMEIATLLADIPVVDVDGCEDDHSCAEVLRAGYASPSGWVRVGSDAVAPPSRIRKLGSADLGRGIPEVPGLLVPRQNMVAVSVGTDIRRARDMIRGLMTSSEEEEEDINEDSRCTKESVVAVVEEGEIIGVIEVGTLLGEH